MSRVLLLDLLERAFFTFLQAFLGSFLAFNATDLTTAKTAAVAALAAGVAAALALVKGFAASRLGDGTASTVPHSLKAPDLSGP